MINIIVTAVVILLVSGFLAKGRQNAQEGSNLSSSVEIEALATTFLKAAVAEKRQASVLIRSNSKLHKNELLQYRQAGIDSHDAAKKLTREISKILSNNQDYFKGTRYSIQVAKQTSRIFENQTRHSQVYRDYTTAELQRMPADRDQAIMQLVPDSIYTSIESVEKILDSLTFLPSQNAVMVDRYKELNASYWRLFRDIADYDELLTVLNFTDVAPDAKTLEQFTVLESDIENGWKELQSFNPENAETRLQSMVERASKIYYHNHSKLITKMKAGTQYGFQEKNSVNAWEHSIKQVRSAQQAVVESVHQRTDAIGVALHRNAARSISTMAIVLVLCLACSFLLFWLGRRIQHQADTDNLTGLANRSTLESTLQLSSQRDSSKFRQAVFLIDIKNFKQFNDNYGHNSGDKLLIEVANRLKNGWGGHLVARIGGDDFAVHMNNIGHNVCVESLAEDIIDSINGDMQLNGSVIRVEVAIGYAVSPDDSPSGTALLKNADIAFYRGSKGLQAGKKQHIYGFNSNIGDKHVKRRRLESDLQDAIEKQEFMLHYQPKVCTTTGTVRSVEALIRWQRADSTLISPADFIPIAEELGLMEQIGTFVLQKACLDIANLQNEGFAGLGVAVNISSQQFMDEMFFEKVMQAAQSANLRTGFLELEVTESIVMNDIGRVTEILNKLRATGVAIAVDDFGTGYSCLSYLQDLPLDTLKIDRAFVDKLDKTLPHQTVANSIVQLAVLFGLTTVAEGVENDKQRYEVARLGIDLIQGYYYSKPVSLEQLPEVIRQIESSQPNYLETPNATLNTHSGPDDDEPDQLPYKAA